MLNKYQKAVKIGLYTIIVVLLTYLIMSTDFEEMLEHIKGIRVTVLVALVSFQCLTQLLLVLQWNRITVCVSQKSSLSKMFYILSTGSVIEALTPGAKVGGEVTRLFYLKKEMNLDTKEATNIIIVQKSISMSVLFSICIMSMIYLFLTIQTGLSIIWQILLTTIAFLVLFALILVLTSSEKLIKHTSKRKSAISNKITPWLESYHHSLSMIPKSEWFKQFMISMVVWLLFPLKMLILARSMGVNQHFLVILALTMTAYMIGTLPLTPGGLGAFEGTMIALLTMIQVSPSVAVTITGVFRFITFWLVMIISGMYTLYYNHKQKRKNR